MVQHSIAITDELSLESAMSKKSSNGLSVSDNYIYTPSSTDITIRWRKAGWVPPTEDPKYQKKWADFRIQCAQGIESIGRAAPQFNPSVVGYKKKGLPDT